MHWKKSWCISNQERAKEAVVSVHVGYPSIVRGGHCNDVTSFKMKHSACGNRKLVPSQRVHWWMSHGDHFVVHKDRNSDRLSSVATPVNLFVNVITSRDGYSKFSVFILHTACEMAVGST